MSEPPAIAIGLPDLTLTTPLLEKHSLYTYVGEHRCLINMTHHILFLSCICSLTPGNVLNAMRTLSLADTDRSFGLASIRKSA